MDKVFLTGASGFIGKHVLIELLRHGYYVKVLIHFSPPEVPDEFKEQVLPIRGSLSDIGSFVNELRDCRYLIHTAAIYSFSPKRSQEIYLINVRGTASLLEAARICGVEKCVYTSSSATLGPASPFYPLDESSWDHFSDDTSAYHHSKLLAEQKALATQVDICSILPTTPVGPGDSGPTPTGKIIINFAKGLMFAVPTGGINLVAVEDVASAHVLALTKGVPGERYIVGAKNLTYAELWDILSELTGKRPALRKVPYRLVGLASFFESLLFKYTDHEPLVPKEGLQMSQKFMYADGSKATRDLGLTYSSVENAIQRALVWYKQHGYV